MVVHEEDGVLKFCSSACPRGRPMGKRLRRCFELERLQRKGQAINISGICEVAEPQVLLQFSKTSVDLSMLFRNVVEHSCVALPFPRIQLPPIQTPSR